jgi:hypothetical protein
MHALLALAACAGSQRPHRPTQGGIAGLARDHDSGDPVASADVHVRAQGQMGAQTVTTAKDGTYRLDHLPPGIYSVNAEFAGQPIDVEHVDVHAGDTAVVDLTFTLGRPDPIRHDFGNPKDGAIDHYRPPHLARSRAVIEGTINDAGTHGRVAGAVVYAVDQAGTALSTVSDDLGRFRFDTSPGTYAVSAYYSIGGRGQIEVRRMGIEVAGAEAVVVPLWIEIAKQ